MVGVVAGAGASKVRRMMTARHPNASPYNYATWQGNIPMGAGWGSMAYSGGNSTTTTVSKQGP